MGRTTLTQRQELDAALKATTAFVRCVQQVLGAGAMQAAGGPNLCPSKVQLLKLLRRPERQSQGQVARYLGVSDPAASQLVASLVKQKLVFNTPAKRDRRVSHLQLTPQGRKYIQTVEREQRTRLQAAMRLAGTRSPARWAVSMETLARSLAEVEPDSNGFCMHCSAHADPTCVRGDDQDDCDFRRTVARRNGSNNS